MIGVHLFGALPARVRAGLMAATLVLPLLVPGLFWAGAHLARESGAIWHVRIMGYDPRDLLHGRYIQFRFDWGDDPGTGTGGGDCLCLARADDPLAAPMVRWTGCDAPAAMQCESIIPRAAATGVQRYYIPEDGADNLDALVRTEPGRFTLEIAVPSGGGAPVLRMLRVDGMDLGDYLRTEPVAGQPE